MIFSIHYGRNFSFLFEERNRCCLFFHTMNVHSDLTKRHIFIRITTTNGQRLVMLSLTPWNFERQIRAGGTKAMARLREFHRNPNKIAIFSLWPGQILIKCTLVMGNGRAAIETRGESKHSGKIDKSHTHSQTGQAITKYISLV